MLIQRNKTYSAYLEDMALKNKLRRHYLSNKALRNTEVDIIMPTFNRSESLVNAIGSILDQLHQNWHLYICDDGSTDDTNKSCIEYAHDLRINYFQLPHKGVSAARNFGLSHAKSGIIFFLDSDNKWNKEYLSLMISFMDYFSLESAYCSAKLIDINQTRWLGDFFDWQACAKKNYIDINCFAIKNINIHQQFDEDLERLVDWDFVLGNTVNTKISYLPSPLVDYCNDPSKNRISTTVYQGELKKYIKLIQQRYFHLMRSKNNIDSRLQR